MSDLIFLTLPDGSVREMPRGTTGADVAASIGPGLLKAALAARVDGEIVDLSKVKLIEGALMVVLAASVTLPANSSGEADVNTPARVISVITVLPAVPELRLSR